MNTSNLTVLTASELDQTSGGVVAVAVLFATYTFVMPLLALGVAVGVDEALEGAQ